MPPASKNYRLLRLPEVLDTTGLRTTAIYARAKAGLFPPPIKLTQRSSAWPESEVTSVISALVAGKTEDEIRQLVAQLVAERARAAA